MWYNKYVGIPYKEAGRDTTGIDCWGLLRLIYKEQYNIDIPSFSEHYTSTKDRELTTELIAQNKEQWVQQESPEPGCAILFRILGLETHIGIYIGDDNFIHAKDGHSSVIESLSSSKWKNRIVGYFKYVPTADAVLNAVPHPLKTERYTESIKIGTTIAELVDSINTKYNVSDKLKFNLAVMVNGVPVAKDAWATTVIKADDKIEYRAIPRGDDPLRMVLMIAVMIAAPQLAGMVAIPGTFAYTATTLAIQMVGMALADAIAPVRTPETQNPGQTQGINMFTGGSNQMNPYGSIPVVLGKIRMTPPLGAQPIIDSPEETSYLRMMTVWGFGPLYLDDSTLLIGASPLKDFKDNNGYEPERFNLDFNPAGDSASAVNRFNSIYSSDISQQLVQVELDNSDTGGMNRAQLYSQNRRVSTGAVYSGTATQNNLSLTVNSSTGTFFLRDQGWTTNTETFTISAAYENTTATANYVVYKNTADTLPFATLRSSTDVIITDGENYLLPSGNQVFLYGYGVNMTTVPAYNVQFSLYLPTSNGNGLSAAINATTGVISLSIPTAWSANIAYFVFRATYTVSGVTQTKDVAYTVYKTSDTVFDNQKLVIDYETQVFTAATGAGAKLQDLPESSGTWQQAAITDNCTELQVALHFPEGMRRLKVKGEGAGSSSPTSFIGEYQYRKINLPGGGSNEPWSVSAYTTSDFSFNVQDFNPADAEYGNNYGTLYKWYRIALTDGKGLTMLEGDPSYSSSSMTLGSYHTAINQSAYYAGLAELPERTFIRLPDLPIGAKLLYDICLMSDSSTLSLVQTIDHRSTTLGVPINPTTGIGDYSGLGLGTTLVNTNADPLGGGGGTGTGADASDGDGSAGAGASV